MNVLGIIATNTHLFAHIGRVAGETITTDAKGVTTNSAFLPETTEIVWGGIASVIIIGVLIKFAGPMVTKYFAARTERIQKELDASEADMAEAAEEAEQIRLAKGDIEAERTRIMADAKVHAEQVLVEGRVRLDQEVAELEARTAAEIQAAHGRVGDELRAEISRLSSAAVDQVVNGSLDDNTHQELIENFIARVGASK